MEVFSLLETGRKHFVRLAEPFPLMTTGDGKEFASELYSFHTQRGVFPNVLRRKSNFRQDTILFVTHVFLLQGVVKQRCITTRDAGKSIPTRESTCHSPGLVGGGVFQVEDSYPPTHTLFLGLSN